MFKLTSPFHNLLKLKSRRKEVFNSIDNSLNTSISTITCLKTQGYVVVPFLTKEEVLLMNEKLLIFVNSLKQPLGNLFYTSGRDEVALRNFARETTISVLRPIFQRIINEDIIEITDGAAWLLKPSGDESGLSPHQDSSLIDETKFASFYGWIAIQDTTVKNGCMHVVPGSHLWGNHYRSLDVPWMFENYTDLLLQHSKPIEMKAGEILLFDSALIHGSYPNYSDRVRAAINLLFKPKDVDLIHYARFSNTPKNKIESYKVSLDFFYEDDFRRRPDSDKYPFLGYVNQTKSKLTSNRVVNLCKQGRNVVH